MTELREFNVNFFRSADQRWIAANYEDADVQKYVLGKAIQLVKCTNLEDPDHSAESIRTLGRLKETGVLTFMPESLLNDKLTADQRAFYDANT